jgi:4-hydroxy-tetrahydrodipicolinate reductase
VTDPIDIALVGAAGRMGRAIARAATGRDDLRVIGAAEHPSCEQLGCDLGELTGTGPTGVQLTGDLAAAIGGAATVIDLSHPSATADVAAAAAAAGAALVCGTTGIADEARAALERAATSIPVLYAPNLSPGIAVMTALLERAVRALGRGYDVEIAELHHRQKVDAPSGTALQLARVAAVARGLDDSTFTTGREGRTGARTDGEIGVMSLRGGGVFGEHTAILAGEHERLELTHRAASRELFAEGALRAALFLTGKPAGRYTMAHVLGLEPS